VTRLWNAGTNCARMNLLVLSWLRSAESRSVLLCYCASGTRVPFDIESMHTGMRDHLIAKGRGRNAGYQDALLIMATPDSGTPNSGVKQVSHRFEKLSGRRRKRGKSRRSGSTPNSGFS